ncbi:hypothetical protein [Streptomyces ipomoeae]|uniref:hypothetical protein n=1 Tax=Streptomyces ipomoeae TaxID=103232 RepID=UPI0011468DA5|nr:hypothetical protein [Streptomyces ipomoeae]TQE33053.1 hypothetical protein Sipo7851_21355 [Streptomyces ipomoeae]
MTKLPPLTQRDLAEIQAGRYATLDGNELRRHIGLLLAEVERLRGTTVAPGPHYVPRWDGGQGKPTSDYKAAWREAVAAHKRGERNAGVSHYGFLETEWVAAAEQAGQL